MKFVRLLACAVVLVIAMTVPASANSSSLSGSYFSIYNWTTGTTARYQQHAGDDMQINVGAATAAIDLRWINCAGTKTGTINYNVAPGQGRIWSNFIQNACFYTQYRGYTVAPGAWNGTIYWNYNFV